MNGLIRASLANSRAVTAAVVATLFVGYFSATSIPIDILPVFKSPAVQVLTFYGGMPAASIEKDITNRMERWTGQAAGTRRQESRSIVGASIIRNYYSEDIDPNSALTQVNSLASAAVPNLPPGTLPPVILPFDPTSTVPSCLVALDSGGKESEAMMYDVGRYEVRNFIMESKGAVAPVVYGGKLRAVLAYLDRTLLQGRNLSPVDVMKALDNYNIFLPTGSLQLRLQSRIFHLSRGGNLQGNLCRSGPARLPGLDLGRGSKRVSQRNARRTQHGNLSRADVQPRSGDDECLFVGHRWRRHARQFLPQGD